MSDILAQNTFLGGGVVNPTKVNENFYGIEATSYKKINGYLTDTNRDSSWTIKARQIRNQALANGKMVGLTGNLDYVKEIFPSDNTDTGAYTAIPGAGISFFLPFDASLVVFTWAIVAANNQNMGGTDVSEFKMYIDDVFSPHQFRAVPEGNNGGSTRQPFRDRHMSGHAIRNNLTKGFHTAEVRVFCNEKLTRVRIRNMKVIWFR